MINSGIKFSKFISKIFAKCLTIISCELSQTNIKPLSNEVRLARTPTRDKEQKEKLKKVFLDWKGDLEQVDDFCLIGRGLSNEVR